MKLSRIPLSNKLQAIETILDSESQKVKSDRRRLTLALKLTRSVQRQLFGQRYVKEWTLLRHINPRDYSRLSKRYWTDYKSKIPSKKNLNLGEVLAKAEAQMK